MAGGIIAKLRPSLTSFVTSLKHKRRDFGIANFIGCLYVEQKARAKYAHGKKVEGSSSTHAVKKKNHHTSHNHKKKARTLTIEHIE